MKLTFPCDGGDKNYDSENDGNVWCWKLVNREYCDRAAKCMAIAEKELCDAMNSPRKIITNNDQIKEALTKELELEPEFAEAV